MKDKQNNRKKRLIIAISCMFLGAGILFGGVGIAVGTAAKTVGYVMIALGGVIAGVSTMFFY